jgi:tetratricopeptide (TPR) repeat protein
MPSPPLAHAALSLALLGLVSAACGRGATDGPEQGLYQRAHAAALARKEPEARRLYAELLRKHPGTRFSADAHFALAELLFNSGDFDAAFIEYGQVLAIPTARSRGYALFKQAWCHLNQNRPAQALQIFERVIGLEHDDRLPAEQRRTLVETARRDLVKAYAQIHVGDGPGESAVDYFTRWGGDAVIDLLDRLAAHHFEQEHLAEAQRLYRDLIAAHVDSPRLCSWQNSLVRIAMVIGKIRDQVTEVQHLGAVLSRIEKVPELRAADRITCRDHLRDTLKELTIASHKRGQQEKAPEKTLSLYELVDPLYRQYLTRFPDEQDAAAMTFYHADVLWTLARWEDAAREYLRVMQMDPKGKFLREAAYAYVLATKNALKLDDQAGSRADGAPSSLSKADQNMIAAFDIYLAHVPDGHEALTIEYRRARMYYDHGDHERAATLLHSLIDRHGDSDDELIGYAMTTELDCLQALGRHDQLIARARALRGSPAAKGDPALAKTLQTIAQMTPPPNPNPAP